ncbi:hypothetical protein ACXYMX_02800 [Sporosarcina sp. CAU 1771]
MAEVGALLYVGNAFSDFMGGAYIIVDCADKLWDCPEILSKSPDNPGERADIG